MRHTLILMAVWVMAAVGWGDGVLFSNEGGRIVSTIARSKTIYLYPTGGTNDHLMIEAALDNDTCIILIDGLYQITGDITLTGYSNLTIEGNGPSTIIKNVGGGGYSCFLQAGPGHDITIRNLTIDNNNVGNPFDAFDKCIFINGNQPDPALCYNILVEGVTALNAEAEALCFDYQYYTTVRNCITIDSAWAGITMAQNKYGNIYNNKIVRSGNNPRASGSLCAGINVQSSPYTIVHDNWIHNPWYGGVAISTSMDAFGTSHNCSVYGNMITGFLSSGNNNDSQGAIDVLISGPDPTIIPYSVDIFSNHVNQTYLSVQFDYTGNANGELNLACSGTANTPFIDVEVGDKIYLDGDGTKVVDGYYYVAGIDDSTYDYINLKMPQRIDITPANVEVGDVFNVILTATEGTSAISYTAQSPTAADVVDGLYNLIVANRTLAGGYVKPWIFVGPSKAGASAALYLTAEPRDYEFSVVLSTENVDEGTDNQTLTQAPYYGLTADLSTNLYFLHGSQSAGVYITDGTDIQIHNNFLNGKATSAAILMNADIGAGSNVYAYDNIVGANYTYKVRSLSATVDFKGRPLSVPVNVTANTTCGYYPRGTTFTNVGDTNALGFTLPTAKAGDEFIFVDLSTTDTADITITTAGAETVRGFDTTVAGNTDNTYGLIWLKCMTDGTWEVLYSVGTWS